jgi:hypothetical protein
MRSDLVAAIRRHAIRAGKYSERVAAASDHELVAAIGRTQTRHAAIKKAVAAYTRKEDA